MQTFIDKFRYNAKRASLVQSRIKVHFFHSCLHVNNFVVVSLNRYCWHFDLGCCSVTNLMSDLKFLSALSQALERMEHVDAVVSDPEYVCSLNYCTSVFCLQSTH